MPDITMPQLSESMSEGKLLKWCVGEGEIVEAGDVIAEVETDKANMEIEVLESGVMGKLYARAGEMVPVGRVIARLDGVEGWAENAEGSDGGDEEAGADENEMGEAEADGAEMERAPDDTEPRLVVQPWTPAATAAPVSPLAARMAEMCQIDLAQVTGSGPGGRIMKEDVVAYRDGHGGERQNAQPKAAPAPPAAPAAQQRDRNSLDSRALEELAQAGRAMEGRLDMLESLTRRLRAETAAAALEPATERTGRAFVASARFDAGPLEVSWGAMNATGWTGEALSLADYAARTALWATAELARKHGLASDDDLAGECCVGVPSGDDYEFYGVNLGRFESLAGLVSVGRGGLGGDAPAEGWAVAVVDAGCAEVRSADPVLPPEPARLAVTLAGIEQRERQRRGQRGRGRGAGGVVTVCVAGGDAGRRTVFKFLEDLVMRLENPATIGLTQPRMRGAD